MATITTLSKIKKGELFRFKGFKKVYLFEGGGPKRGYSMQAFDDISSFKSVKNNREIEIGFDF